MPTSGLHPGSGQGDPYARTHGRGEVDRLQVLALRRLRLRRFDGRLQRLEVLGELLGGEAGLADRRVDHAGLVAAELDLARLERADDRADVGADGAGLRVRQEAAGAEDAPELRAHLG